MSKTNQYADLQNVMAAQIWMRANGRHAPARTMGAVPKAAKDAAADLIALYEDANGGPVDGEIHRLYQRYFEARFFEKSRPKGPALDKVFEQFARCLVDEAEGAPVHDEIFDGAISVPTFDAEYDGTELTWEGDATNLRKGRARGRLTGQRLPRRRRNPQIPSEESYLGETLGSPAFASNPTGAGPCGKCGAPTRMKYPGNEPENGPARPYCKAGHAPCVGCGKWFKAIDRHGDVDACPACIEGSLRDEGLIDNPVNRSISSFADGIRDIGASGVAMLWSAIGVADKAGEPIGTFRKVVDERTVAVQLPDGEIRNYPAASVYPYEKLRRNPACPACGAHIASGASSCPSCGLRVRADDKRATPLEPPKAFVTRRGRPPGVPVGNPGHSGSWLGQHVNVSGKAPGSNGREYTGIVEAADPPVGDRSVLTIRPDDGGAVRTVPARWVSSVHLDKMIARLPAIDELAKAYSYIDGEYRLHEGSDIDGEMWAEGLAFVTTNALARRYVDPADLAVVRELYPQLSERQWRWIAARADGLLVSEGERPAFKATGE